MPYGYGSANRGSGASHDRGGGQQRATAARQVAAARPRDHHPGESTGREQAIASRTYARPGTRNVIRPSHHIGGADINQQYNKNIRNLARQQQYRQGAYQRAHPFLSKLGGIGGLLKGIGRGALGFFGGLPGKALSGIMTASDWAKRKGSGVLQGIGEFGETDEEGNPLYPTLDRYLNRNTGKYDDKPYMGQGNRNFTFDDQVATNVTNPNLTDATGAVTPNYNFPPTDYIDEYTPRNVVPQNLPLYPTVGQGAAEGGRIGLSNGMTPFMAWVKDQYGVNVGEIKDWNFYSGLANEWKRLGGSKADGGIARLL